MGITTTELTHKSFLLERLSSMQAEFKQSIDKSNKERELLLSELRSFVKATAKTYDDLFKQQDELNKSIQKAQETTEKNLEENTKCFKKLLVDVATLTALVQQLISQNTPIPNPPTTQQSTIYNVDTGFSPLWKPTEPMSNNLFPSDVSGQFPPLYQKEQNIRTI